MFGEQLRTNTNTISKEETNMDETSPPPLPVLPTTGDCPDCGLNYDAGDHTDCMDEEDEASADEEDEKAKASLPPRLASVEEQYNAVRQSVRTPGSILPMWMCNSVLPSSYLYSTRGVMFTLSARLALTRLADAGFRALDSHPDDASKLLHPIDGILTPAEQSNPTLPLDWFEVSKKLRRTDRSSVEEAENFSLGSLQRVRDLNGPPKGFSLDSKLPKLPPDELAIGRYVANLTIGILIAAERLAKKSHGATEGRKLHRIYGTHVLAAVRQSPPEARSCLERLGMWKSIDEFDTEAIDLAHPPHLLSDDLWLTGWCFATQIDRVVPLLERAAWYLQPKLVQPVIDVIVRRVRAGLTDGNTTVVASATTIDHDSVHAFSPTSLDQGDAFFSRRYHIHPVAYLGRSLHGALTASDEFTVNGDAGGGDGSDDEVSHGMDPSDLALDMLLFDLDDRNGRRWPLMAEWRLEASGDAPCGTHHGAIYHRPSGILIGRIHCTGPDEGGFSLDQPIASKLFAHFAPHGNGLAERLPVGQVRPHTVADNAAAGSSSAGGSSTSSPAWSSISSELTSLCCAALTLTFNVAPERLLTLWTWYHPVNVKEMFTRAVLRAAFGCENNEEENKGGAKKHSDEAEHMQTDSVASTTSTTPFLFPSPSSVVSSSFSSSCPLPIVLIEIISSYYSFDLPYLPLHFGLDTGVIYDESAVILEHQKNPTVGVSDVIHPRLDGKLGRFFEEYLDGDSPAIAE